MDKSWIKERNKFSTSYINGVKLFIDFAKQNLSGKEKVVRCPCVICNNAFYKSLDKVEYDLHINGFKQTYVNWIFHGEAPEILQEDDEKTFIDVDDNNMGGSDDFGMGDDLHELLEEIGEAQQANSDNEEHTTNFAKLLEDSQRALYPGCKMSLLSVIVKLLHIKVSGKWSDKSFNTLLEFLKNILPEGETLPNSFYGARRLLVEVGLGYEEIDACKNDCVLFWKENENKSECPICKESRWKNYVGKKVPHKKLRYFPIKPRLQRLFMSKKTASKMRWHKDKRQEEDGIARHPADSLAWKHLDDQYPEFCKDPRNVRLGLASDGFTPWSNLGNTYSMWPVILSVYNLPPYDCMKPSFLMMSLLIPGPSYPGKNIDVYLQPLIEDLKDLWNVGVETYDACSKEKFQMRAAVLWTISDLPGYSLLSGWQTSGYHACPCCFDKTDSKRLRTKICYMGHRRFLSRRHGFRKNKSAFNGEEEHRDKPKELTGVEILRWLNSLVGFIGKAGKCSGKRKRDVDQGNWVKKSIFFELPYWHILLIRHCLDVMHIEKNICENILWTLLDIKGRTKDPVVAREDLRDWGVREELHMQVRAGDNKVIKPPACYTLSQSEQKKFHEFLNSIKYPDAFAANIAKRIKENKISGLKTHDCHILIQRLIPAGIRGFLNKEVTEALYELGDYFKELCSKTLKDEDVERLDKNIPVILCKLEKIFPPYFFTIMVHLTVHLAQEAKIAGPVQFRWMYPIERFLGNLKGYVRNRTHPEGSIAQGYIVHESLTFLSMYIPDMETKFNRVVRNYDCGDEKKSELSVFSMKSRPFGKVKTKVFLSEEELDKAHWYILNNCDEVEPYIAMHKDELQDNMGEVGASRNVDDVIKKTFPKWFKNHVNDLWGHKSKEVSHDLWCLANGPLRLNSSCYNGCVVNEVRFHTKDRDAVRTTQNSGIYVEGLDNKEYFGFLKRVVELSYIGGSCKAVLFECEWFNSGHKKTFQSDKCFTSIDVSSRWYKDDPFVLPNQVQQVFYINDTKLGKNWQIVQKVRHRHVWDLPELEVTEDDIINDDEQEHTREVMQQYDSQGVNLIVDVDNEERHRLSRNDVEPKVVDEAALQKLKKPSTGRVRDRNSQGNISTMSLDEQDNEYEDEDDEEEFEDEEEEVENEEDGDDIEDDSSDNGDDDDDEDEDE